MTQTRSQKTIPLPQVPSGLEPGVVEYLQALRRAVEDNLFRLAAQQELHGSRIIEGTLPESSLNFVISTGDFDIPLLHDVVFSYKATNKIQWTAGVLRYGGTDYTVEAGESDEGDTIVWVDVTSLSSPVAFGHASSMTLTAGLWPLANRESTNVYESFSSPSINGGVIVAKTVRADQIDVDNLFAEYIQLGGKIYGGDPDFADNEDFWLGVDEADSDKKKFRVGNATNYVSFNGTSLVIHGTVTIVGSGAEITEFVQATPPTSLHIGDRWCDSDNGSWYVAASVGADEIAEGEWEGLAGPAGPAGEDGTDGTDGTRTIRLAMYKWAATTPTSFPSGNCTYTWATGAFSNPPTLNGWSTTPGAEVEGQTLWVCYQHYSDAATASTSTVNWTPSSAYPVGAAGSDGADGSDGSDGTIYFWQDATPTTQKTGDVWYHPTNDVFKFWDGDSWESFALTASSIAAGTLAAAVTLTQTLTVGTSSAAGTITISNPASGGDAKIQCGKTDFGQDTTAGFILGHDQSAGVTKFEIGTNAAGYLRWTGSALNINGSITCTDLTAGVIDDDAVTTGKLADNAVTQVVTVTSMPGTATIPNDESFADMGSITIIKGDSDSKITVTFTVTFAKGADNLATYAHWIRVRKSGSTIGDVMIDGIAYLSQYHSMSITITDTATGTGSREYVLQAATDDPTATQWYFLEGHATAMETKR